VLGLEVALPHAVRQLFNCHVICCPVTYAVVTCWHLPLVCAGKGDHPECPDSYTPHIVCNDEVSGICDEEDKCEYINCYCLNPTTTVAHKMLLPVLAFLW
jgi:hypothetical protein